MFFSPRRMVCHPPWSVPQSHSPTGKSGDLWCRCGSRSFSGKEASSRAFSLGSLRGVKDASCKGEGGRDQHSSRNSGTRSTPSALFGTWDRWYCQHGSIECIIPFVLFSFIPAAGAMLPCAAKRPAHVSRRRQAVSDSQTREAQERKRWPGRASYFSKFFQ